MKCIFCMNEKEESEQICPVCKKGLWEYKWQEGFLEPYIVLRSKYMIGSGFGTGWTYCAVCRI